MPRLSEQFVARSKPAGKREATYFDGGIPGFALLVGPSYRRFVLRVTRGGKSVTHKLGRYDANTFNAAAARKAAQAILARDDPAAKPSAGPTLAAAWSAWRAALIARPASPSTIRSYDLAFRQLAHLHDTSLRAFSLDTKIIRDEHAKLEVAGKRGSADAMARFVRALYAHASRADDLPPRSPTHAVNWCNLAPRTRALAWTDLADWEKQRLAIENEIQRELALFLILSGLRRTDACSAKWEDLRMRRRVMHRPNPKGRQTKKPAFDLPLSKPMLRCLWRVRRAGRRLYEKEARTWIFPAASASGHIREIKDQGLSHTGHDLRRTFATMAMEVGVPEEIVKRLLNHSLGNITARYQVSSALASFLRDQMEKVSTHIVSGLNA